MSATDMTPDYGSSARAPILVTGGTGFVGQHVVAKLVADGHRVRLPYRNNVPPVWRENSQIDLIKVDNLAVAALEPLIEGCAAIVHLAGLAHVGKADRVDTSLKFTLMNDELTARLVAAVRYPEKVTFIHLSSLAAVTPNACDGIIDDSTNPLPDTPYGRSKRAAELHVQGMVKSGAFAVSLRPPLVVGADAKGNWRSLQKLAATGLPLPFADIAGRRSFISVQSLTEAVALLCNGVWSTSLSGNYCIADPETLSLPEVLTELRRGMGLTPNLLPCPPQVFNMLGTLIGRRRQLAGLTGPLQVDPARFAAAFSFAPSLPIREAIYRSGENFRALRSTAQNSRADETSPRLPI